MYITNSQIEFKTTILKSSLCAYIGYRLPKTITVKTKTMIRTITVVGQGVDAATTADRTISK